MTSLWLFIFEKNDVNVPSKNFKQQNSVKFLSWLSLAVPVVISNDRPLVKALATAIALEAMMISCSVRLCHVVFHLLGRHLLKPKNAWKWTRRELQVLQNRLYFSSNTVQGTVYNKYRQDAVADEDGQYILQYGIRSSTSPQMDTSKKRQMQEAGR